MADQLRRRKRGEFADDLGPHNRLIDAVNRNGGLTVAYPLELHKTPTGLHLRLARQPMLRFVRLTPDPIEPQDTDRSGNVLDYDAENTQWLDTTTDGGYSDQTFAALTDPQDTGLYLPDERRVVYFDPNSGKQIPVGPPGPHLAKATEDVAHGESATVEIYHVNTGGEEVQTEIELTAYNFLLPKIWDGAACMVQFHPQSRRWYISDAYSATLLRGKQVGALSDTDTTNAIDNLSPLNGHFPISGTSTSVTAHNILAWEADDDAETYLLWNDLPNEESSEGQWEMIQVECPA